MSIVYTSTSLDQSCFSICPMRNNNTSDLVRKDNAHFYMHLYTIKHKVITDTLMAFSAFPSDMYRLLRVRGALSNIASIFMAFSRARTAYDTILRDNNIHTCNSLHYPSPSV